MASVLVIGAGLAGLTAAADLRDAGHDVRVVDKGHRPGGRMATRHEGPATFDHGAQFLTAKSDPFAREVRAWCDQELAATWFHGSPDASAGGDSPEGHPRYRGRASMRAIPERLAASLPVQCNARVAGLARTEGRWVAHLDEGDALVADAVVVTPPAPQAVALLDGTGVPTWLVDDLRSIPFSPCWAVLVRPDGSPDLPTHGALRLADHPLHFITDNQRKGISTAPAVTLHASAERSRELLDVPGDDVGAALLADAAAWVRGRVLRTHRWRWSRPEGPGPDAPLVTTAPGPLVVAGDGLAGGRVEGAWRSGRAAARMLTDHLD